MKPALLVAAFAACSSAAHEAKPAAPAPAATATGSIVWVKPPADESGMMSRDPLDHYRLMVLDVARKTSTDIGEATLRRRATVDASGTALRLIDGTATALLRRDGGGWKQDAPAHLGAAPSSLDAVAPDGSSGVIVHADGVCVLTPGGTDCAPRIPLPFEWDIVTAAAYTSGNRLVVTVPTGKQDANAVGMGARLQIAVVDLTAKTVAQLAVPAIGYVACVSPDGRLAWTEQAGDQLVLAVAPIDRLAAVQTFPIGPAVAQAYAECQFAGERIVTVVRPAAALLSIAPKTRTVVTLVPSNVMPPDVIVSADGAWVAYALISDDLSQLRWFATPIDRAASQPLALDTDAPVLGWLR